MNARSGVTALRIRPRRSACLSKELTIVLCQCSTQKSMARHPALRHPALSHPALSQIHYPALLAHQCHLALHLAQSSWL